MLCVFALLLALELGVAAGQTDSWNAFRLSQSRRGLCQTPMSLAFNHDGDVVAACYSSGTLVKYVKYGKGNYTAAGPSFFTPTSTCLPISVVFHLNSGNVAATCYDFNFNKSKAVVHYTQDTSGMYTANYLLSSVPNGQCRLDSIARSIATNSAGDLLVGCSDIMKFSFDNGTFNATRVGWCGYYAGSVAFTPFGDVVAGCDDTIIKFEKTAGGYNQTVLSDTCKAAYSVAVNAAGDIVVACARNNASQSIIKFTYTSGTYTATYLSSISNGNCPYAVSVAINSAGDVVAACKSADFNSSVVLYSYRQGTYYASALSAAPGGNCRTPLTVAFSPLDDVVAGCTGEGDSIENQQRESIVLYTIKDDKHTRTHSITSHRLGNENDHDDL